MDRKTSEPKREPIIFGSKSYPDRATRTRVNEWIGSVARVPCTVHERRKEGYMVVTVIKEKKGRGMNLI